MTTFTKSYCDWIITNNGRSFRNSGAAVGNVGDPFLTLEGVISSQHEVVARFWLVHSRLGD